MTTFIPREAWVTFANDQWKKEAVDKLANAESFLVGLYDQTIDEIAPFPGAPLDAATNYQLGQYYLLVTGGTFVTAIPELNGLVAAANDTVISDGTQWILVTSTGDFLSSVNDDTAAGTITFSKVPTISAAPVSPNDATRKTYVDTENAADRAYADSQDAAHVADADPHTQYLQETVAVQTFAFAAYGGLQLDTPYLGADIGGTWQTIQFDTVVPSTPKGITVDIANNTISFANSGVYAISINITFEHVDSQQGRITYLRLYNVTNSAALPGTFAVGTGRNAEVTSFSLTTLVEIVVSDVGDVFRLEIGGGSSYSGVDWNFNSFTAWNVGEWRGAF